MKKTTTISVLILAMWLGQSQSAYAVGSACCNEDGTSCTTCAGLNCGGLCSGCAVCGGPTCGAEMACCIEGDYCVPSGVFEGCCRGMGGTPMSTCSGCLLITSEDASANNPSTVGVANKKPNAGFRTPSRPALAGCAAAIAGIIVGRRLFCRLHA